MIECTHLMDVRIRHISNGISVHQRISNMKEMMTSEKMQTLLREFGRKKGHLAGLGIFLNDLRRTYMSRWIKAYEDRTEVSLKVKHFVTRN